MQREPDRPAGTQSPLAPCISESVSQSVSHWVSQSVNRVARERAKGIIALSFLSLSLSLSFFSRSLSLSHVPYVTTVYSHLSLSLSFFPLILTFLLVHSFLHCASFFSSFTRSLRSRTSDRVARPMRHEFSSLLSLSPSLFPRALLRVHQPVRDVYFPRSRAARRRGVGKGRNAPTIPRDRRSVSRDEILIGGLRCLWLKIRGRSGCVLVCNTYGKSAMVRPVATTDGKNLTGRARVYTFARISRHSRRPREANSLSFSRCSERDLLLLRAWAWRDVAWARRDEARRADWLQNSRGLRASLWLLTLPNLRAGWPRTPRSLGRCTFRVAYFRRWRHSAYARRKAKASLSWLTLLLLLHARELRCVTRQVNSWY